ncbi:unnamed protein product [Clonostachys rhizophaga]|uniref:Uncharacterized protein n=1 Tax=Clonostachys rhizophaga TaxID=160324 RepID=A0A9N9V3F9_9HYPO|nr:unnamed protein product [Clonostachys rhizophaga]
MVDNPQDSICPVRPSVNLRVKLFRVGRVSANKNSNEFEDVFFSVSWLVWATIQSAPSLFNQDDSYLGSEPS